MDKTLLPIRLVFVALCAAGGWLVCYSISDWDHYWGVALACVTNKPIAITERLLGALLPDAGFAAVLGGDSGAGVKPAPGPLLAAMATTRVLPCAALMIGDSRHDVHAARAAAVRVICVADGYNHGEDIRREKPDLVVDGLGELL